MGLGRVAPSFGLAIIRCVVSVTVHGCTVERSSSSMDDGISSTTTSRLTPLPLGIQAATTQHALAARLAREHLRSALFVHTCHPGRKQSLEHWRDVACHVQRAVSEPA
ncbi:hypothetical protein K437DRAFT_47897 [Tilletiaria anomala UBC 951]|uniref:Secreted protein n=1 Tax=Tilletiaria anomala (strain ATCC 24038 / CBS 436.72 / UBC 951) TaxID=1037660 RepID=A0A066V654_TILAU|nr:uncharacterized protein K437DRAFT_47897 [Tilletiaria anomala UBC 951]KDN36931.1 hypothetical protein K437DRAFT_47897 [Tilletiaria anomala UBC 951]